MNIFNTPRYIVAAYGLVLQATYPFDSLPVADSVKESLESQVHSIVRISAFISLSVWSIYLWVTALLCTFQLIILLAKRFRPTFREKLQEHAAKKGVDAQKKKKRVNQLRIIIDLVLSIAMIVNDAIFNRPEDAASFQEGVIARTQYLLSCAKVTIILQGLYIIFTVLFAIIFAAIYRRFRKQRVATDEGRHLAPSETAQPGMVQARPRSGLDEKLIDLSDDVDGVYKKVEAYFSRDNLENNTEEKNFDVLIGSQGNTLY